MLGFRYPWASKKKKDFTIRPFSPSAMRILSTFVLSYIDFGNLTSRELINIYTSVHIKICKTTQTYVCTCIHMYVCTFMPTYLLYPFTTLVAPACGMLAKQRMRPTKKRFFIPRIIINPAGNAISLVLKCH